VASSTSSKEKPKSKRTDKRVLRRLNRKALVILGVVLAVGVLGSLPMKWFGERQLRNSALEQSKASAANGDFDLAIRHLDRLLAYSPNDVPALDAKAKLLSDASRFSGDRLTEAIRIHDLLIRLDPDGKGRLDTRRRLAELYINYSDTIRRQMILWDDNASEVKELRYQAALSEIDKLLEIERQSNPPIEDGAAHRLRGITYMAEMPNKSTKSKTVVPQLLEDAKRELLEALRIDPRDVIASEKLAELYAVRLNDPISAERTLDGMRDAMPNSVNVRLARYRAFIRSKEPEKARAELDAAIVIAPLNAELRLQAAGDALARRKAAVARKHLEAIPEEVRKADLRFKVYQGQVEFAEQHPDEAIDQWRQGLSLVGGGDSDLTWHLAYSTIRLGGPRLADAKPLINQYLRLSKNDKDCRGLFLQAYYDQRLGHPTEAIEKFEKVVRIHRGNLLADANMQLGTCYESIGENERALNAYLSAAKAAPANSTPRRAIARLRLAKSPDQAAAELDRALTRNREASEDEKTAEDPGMLFDLIRIRMAQQFQLSPQRRNWKEVENLFSRVANAKQGPVEDTTYVGLFAEYLVASDRTPEALKKLEDATQTEDRKLAATWLNLAGLLDRQNRRAEALKVLDRGMADEAAGDHASLRIAKAQLLINEGKGQAAREALSKNLSNVEMVERPDLYRALGNLLRGLGDRDGARANYVEWVRLTPESIEPVQALLNYAETYGDDEAGKIGLDALRSGRGMNDPYALTAQALELLRGDRRHPGPPPSDRIDRAERLVMELDRIAPALSWKSLIQGRIQELRGNLKEAAVFYRKANNVRMIGPALPRLIEVYIKLRADDQLASLENEYVTASQQSPNLSKEFARVSLDVSRKLADKERVEYYSSRLVDGKAESLQIATAQAMLLDSLGKTQEAEAKLQELVRSRPQEPLAWYSLIGYQQRRRTAADAAKTIEEARKIYRGDRPELFLAQCYRYGGDAANAATFYQKAKDKGPEDLVTLRAYAEFCEATRRDSEVEPVLRKALSVDPTASWAAKGLAMRIAAKQDPATWGEAWRLVSASSSSSGDTPEDRLVRATVLALSPESARRFEAIAAFESLVEDLPIANPIAIDARIRLSRAMLELNRKEDAWKYIAPMADDQSRFNPVALTVGIEALARAGKGEEAQRRLDRLIEEAPKWPQIPLLKAWVLMAKGKKTEASDVLKSAFYSAEKTPEGESTGLAIFDLLVRFGDAETAYEIGQQLASLWPKDAWNLAKVQIVRKEYDQALASCRKSIETGGLVEAREAMRAATSAAIAKRNDLAFVKQVEVIGQTARAKSPNDSSIFVFLAMVLHLEGRYEEEIACYARALELNSANAEFLNNMAWTFSEGLGKYPEALKYIDDAIRRVGPTPDLLDTRGVVQSRLGNQKQAVSDLEASIKLKPQPTTYFHLARVYYQAGNLPESRIYRDMAWKANFNPEFLDPTDRADLTEVMGKKQP
jgi:tetratricopeptide (TPR) repeat protein